MREQECQGAKTLTALLAFVRPLARVQTDMRQEASLLRERLVAVGALEGLLSCVQPTVGLQMRSSAKGLATLRALKRPVPAVGHLVRHQVGRLVEVLATRAASELPLFVVRGEVKGQVSRGDEGFVAHAAAVRVQANVPVWTPTIREAAGHLAGRTSARTLCFGRGRRISWIGIRLWQAECASTI